MSLTESLPHPSFYIALDPKNQLDPNCFFIKPKYYDLELGMSESEYPFFNTQTNEPVNDWYQIVYSTSFVQLSCLYWQLDSNTIDIKHFVRFIDEMIHDKYLKMKYSTKETKTWMPIDTNSLSEHGEQYVFTICDIWETPTSAGIKWSLTTC